MFEFALGVSLVLATGASRPARAALTPAGAGPDKELAGQKLVLAMVVDSADRPEEAAALEVRPYRLLLGKVRVGPGEKTLRPLAAAGIGDEKLARDAERFRGSILHEFGILGEIRRVDAPGVGRFDRNTVYAGIVGTPQGRFFAFRALRRPTDAPLYPGDRIWVSGYFLKLIPLDDASGDRHRMPLVVSPWPTYTGKWWPAGVAGAMAAELGFPLPSRDVPHERVISRLVIDVTRGEEDAPPALAVDGVSMPREDILREMKRSAAAHPGRTMIFRTRSGKSGPAARKLIEQAGVERVEFKQLPPGLTEARGNAPEKGRIQ
jgi:hypothetical protein